MREEEAEIMGNQLYHRTDVAPELTLKAAAIHLACDSGPSRPGSPRHVGSRRSAGTGADDLAASSARLAPCSVTLPPGAARAG